MDYKGRIGELWNLVLQIPPGYVASYGDIGGSLIPPISGLLVGRWIAEVPEGVPWWRVVARDGSLPISKRDPRLAKIQADKLSQEGIILHEGCVPLERFWRPFTKE